jgi:hypothetical protein
MSSNSATNLQTAVLAALSTGGEVKRTKSVSSSHFTTAFVDERGVTLTRSFRPM